MTTDTVHPPSDSVPVRVPGGEGPRGVQEATCRHGHEDLAPARYRGPATGRGDPHGNALGEETAGVTQAEVVGGRRLDLVRDSSESPSIPELLANPCGRAVGSGRAHGG